MITIERYYNDRPADEHRVPEWIRSERYEFCEDFYEGCTGKRDSALWTKLTSVFTTIFH